MADASVDIDFCVQARKYVHVQAVVNDIGKQEYVDAVLIQG